MSLLDLFGLAWVRWVLAGLVLAAAAGGGWKARAVVADRDVAVLVSERNATVAAAEKAGREAAAELHADEARIRAQQGKVDQDAFDKQKSLAVAAARTDGLDRLRDAAREALAARCDRPAGDTTPPDTGADASRPGADVLTDVLAEMGQAGRAMAVQADSRGIALEACIRSYSALKVIGSAAEPVGGAAVDRGEVVPSVPEPPTAP